MEDEPPDDEKPYIDLQLPERTRPRQADQQDTEFLRQFPVQAIPVGILSALFGGGLVFASVSELIFGKDGDPVSRGIYCVILLVMGLVALWLSVRIVRSAFIAEKEIRHDEMREEKRQRAMDMLDEFDRE